MRRYRYGLLAAFQLYPLCASLLNQLSGIQERLLVGYAIREEWHVGDHHGPARAAHHCLRMAQDIVHCDRQGVLVAQHRVAHAVAHQDCRNSRRLYKVRQRRVVRRKHHNLTPLCFHLLEVGDGNACGAHGFPWNLNDSLRTASSFSSTTPLPLAASLLSVGARLLYIIASAIAA